MGFVDQHDDLLAGRVDLDQAFLQRTQQEVGAAFRERHAELLGDRIKDFVA